MSKQFREQIEKSDISVDRIGDNSYLIKKFNPESIPEQLLEVGKTYIFEFLQTEVAINSMRLTSDNWNGGRYITSSGMLCEISKILGAMLQVNGIAYDIASKTQLTEAYYGYWVNRNSIKNISLFEGR